MNDKIIDCHYCEYALCSSPTSYVDCYCEDNCYFDHKVIDSNEAKDCWMFEYCDIFPKC